jgi:hypothetical protein
LLWLPEDCYLSASVFGEELCQLRKNFFSRRLVKDAYLGYATQQFKDLERRGGSFGPDLKHRTAKHARHLLRLCDQGVQLWTEGRIEVRVKDPSRYIEFGEMVAESTPKIALDKARKELIKAECLIENSTTWLPDQPGTAIIEAWLKRVRKFYF